MPRLMNPNWSACSGSNAQVAVFADLPPDAITITQDRSITSRLGPGAFAMRGRYTRVDPIQRVLR